jgi:CRISPR-associated endonuclease/helicase Cas3
MAIDDPLRDLLAEAPEEDLARYLVLAHHGRLRVQVRDSSDLAGLPGLPGDEPLRDVILGLEQGALSGIPPMLGHPATTLRVDLTRFRSETDRSWASTVRGLLDRYGPFRLAYLETLVRMADWRASGSRELPE